MVCPLQAVLVGEASTTPGLALTYAHDNKIKKSGEECRNQGIVVLPIAAESLGGWHPVAVAEVRKLGSALA